MGRAGWALCCGTLAFCTVSASAASVDSQCAQVEAERLQVVQSFLEAAQEGLNTSDYVAIIHEVTAPDAVLYVPDTGTWTGVESIAEYALILDTTFTGGTVVIDSYSVDPADVLVQPESIQVSCWCCCRGDSTLGQVFINSVCLCSKLLQPEAIFASWTSRQTCVLLQVTFFVNATFFLDTANQISLDNQPIIARCLDCIAVHLPGRLATRPENVHCSV